MRTLTITLPAALPAPATAITAVLSSDGSTVQRHIEVPLALLPATDDAEVVAVVPTTRLSWHRLELPRGTLERRMFGEGNSARLRAILEGMVEDLVLDDPAHLHFALAPRAADGAPVWVAVCDRAWLQAWLQAMEQSGRPAVRIVPEVAPLAHAEDAGQLHFTGNAAQPQLIFAVPGGAGVLPFSPATLALFATESTARDALAIWAEPEVAALAEQHFEGRVTVQSGAQRALAAAASEWDLAQFDCSAGRSARSRKRISNLFAALLRAPQWRAARLATAALIVLNLGGIYVWNLQEQATLAAKRAMVNTILSVTFPDTKVVVDAPVQMARAVADLRRQTGTATRGDLEAMLVQYYTMGAGLPPPASLEYAAGELKLKGIDPEAAQRARIAAKLAGMGYKAQMDGDTLMVRQEQQP